ncbi:MAG: hypothetical protein DHS20C01_32110 [marine bacterium B5-7]|nr:MAG: hypothetical protein DHS20C01_32110 [marine bacterium B5-7]
MKTKAALLICILGFLFLDTAWSMGLRSFVALPINKGGAVLRLQHESNQDTNARVAILNAAYGISATQAIFFGQPYRLEPKGSDRLRDTSILYRYTASQQDTSWGTKRLGLLAGVVVPTDGGRDSAIQAGLVSTVFSGRHELDFDVLYQAGTGERLDSGRYDLSWQYRLIPKQYQDWGIGKELHGVIDLGGRWTEGGTTVHQVTMGLQWVNPSWVLEAGVFQDINGLKQTHALVSLRIHI